MNTLPAIADGWITCDRQPCLKDIVELAPDDALWIKTALMTASSDTVQMTALRNLLFGHGQDWVAYRISDWEVIEQVSNLFVTHRLHLHATAVKPVVTISSDGSAGDLGGSEAAPAGPPPRSSSTAYVSDPPTFSAPLDGAAQAAALTAAAAAGQPFCPQ